MQREADKRKAEAEAQSKHKDTRGLIQKLKERDLKNQKAGR